MSETTPNQPSRRVLGAVAATTGAFGATGSASANAAPDNSSGRTTRPARLPNELFTNGSIFQGAP